MMKKHILLTGKPGVGKTTVIHETVRRVSIPFSGFYTQEIRRDNRRVGFEIVMLTGETQTLSHVNIKSKYRVGRYGVDIKGFDNLIIPKLDEACRLAQSILVVDEIGKMECFSNCQICKY